MISCLTSISVCFMCLCYPYVVYSISGRIGTGRSEIFLQRSNYFNFNIDLFPIFQALYRTKQCDTRKLTYFEYRSSCGCHNHLQVVREMDMAFLNTCGTLLYISHKRTNTIYTSMNYSYTPHVRVLCERVAYFRNN
jgi:hypothetical protein